MTGAMEKKVCHQCKQHVSGMLEREILDQNGKTRESFWEANKLKTPNPNQPKKPYKQNKTKQNTSNTQSPKNSQQNKIN